MLRKRLFRVFLIRNYKHGSPIFGLKRSYESHGLGLNSRDDIQRVGTLREGKGQALASTEKMLGSSLKMKRFGFGETLSPRGTGLRAESAGTMNLLRDVECQARSQLCDRHVSRISHLRAQHAIRY